MVFAVIMALIVLSSCVSTTVDIQGVGKFQRIALFTELEVYGVKGYTSRSDPNILNFEIKKLDSTQAEVVGAAIEGAVNGAMKLK